MNQNTYQAAMNTGVAPTETEYPLPTGMTEFEQLFERVKSKVNLPTVDDESIRFALANEILAAPGRKDAYPDSVFVTALRRVAANQVASQVFQDVKARQKAAQEAETAKQTASTVSETLTKIAEATTTASANVANAKTKKHK
jgi:hypothetical protein